MKILMASAALALIATSSAQAREVSATIASLCQSDPVSMGGVLWGGLLGGSSGAMIGGALGPRSKYVIVDHNGVGYRMNVDDAFCERDRRGEVIKIEVP